MPRKKIKKTEIDVNSSIKMDENRTVSEKEWFESDESPVNFFGNCFTSCASNNDGIVLYYRFSAPDYINTAFDDKYTSLKISSTCLRTAPKPICRFEPETTVLDTLIIYGYIPDVDDVHSSRLDYEHISHVFNCNTINKFNIIKVSGSFKNIEDMKNVLSYLYDNLIDDKIYGKIILYASSVVNDEYGKTRSIADLIDNGHSIESRIIGIDYGFLGKRYYTRILKGNLPDEPIGKLDFSSVDVDK